MVFVLPDSVVIFAERCFDGLQQITVGRNAVRPNVTLGLGCSLELRAAIMFKSIVFSPIISDYSIAELKNIQEKVGAGGKQRIKNLEDLPADHALLDWWLALEFLEHGIGRLGRISPIVTVTEVREDDQASMLPSSVFQRRRQVLQDLSAASGRTGAMFREISVLLRPYGISPKKRSPAEILESLFDMEVFCCAEPRAMPGDVVSPVDNRRSSYVRYCIAIVSSGDSHASCSTTGCYFLFVLLQPTRRHVGPGAPGGGTSGTDLSCGVGHHRVTFDIRFRSNKCRRCPPGL